MGFTIPNLADVTYPAQAMPDKVDIDMLAAGVLNDGVKTGCAVTAQGSPNMTVAVASGTVILSLVDVAVSSGNVTITAANGTNPRFDLIVVNNSGTKSAVAGTAAAAPGVPAAPAYPGVPGAGGVPA